MNSLKEKLLLFFATLVLIFMVEFIYIKNPTIMQNINNTLTDSGFFYRGEVEGDKRIIIVDIDERSLAALGQWPWSRNKVAKIIENLTKVGVGIIGLDMVFAERDRSSPRNIAKEMGFAKEDLPDYDEILAQALENSPTVAGFVFNFEHSTLDEAPGVNAIFVEKGKGEKEYLLKPKGVISNIDILQQSAYSSGSFNTLPDKDGVVRYVPLLFSYDDGIYPSLSFEMIRVMMGEKKVEVIYDENGVSGIRVGELEIPTDAKGRLFVNYRGGAKKYRYVSALDIYRNNFKKEDFSGAIVLLGTSAAGLLDLRATPFDSTYPGVEVHANVIDNIINDEFISAPSYAKGIDTISIIVSVVIVSMILVFATPLLSFGLVLGFLMLQATFYYKMLFEEHILLNFAYPLFSTLLTVFVLTFIKIYQENRQKEMISKKFSKKVSPQVAAKLLKNSKDVFEANQTEVSIFFSDIRNFTTISEGFKDPKELVTYLNTYMSPMSEIIIEHEGTIDKYIGDAIMAYWNAPLRVENHADKALTAAIRQIEALRSLNKTLKEKSYPPIEIGIGIHTGEATVGEMGSEGRSDYTVIGDSINLGSRIEGLCKIYGAKILISEATKMQLTKEYKLREIDRVQVKGKEEAVTIYEVFAEGAFTKDEQRLEDLYKKAKDQYKKANFKEAYSLFFKAFERRDDKIFAIYMDRCNEHLKSGSNNIEEVTKYTLK